MLCRLFRGSQQEPVHAMAADGPEPLRDGIFGGVPLGAPQNDLRGIQDYEATMGNTQDDWGSTARVAVCSLNQWALDFDGNYSRIVESIRIAKQQGAKFRVGEATASLLGCIHAVAYPYTCVHVCIYIHVSIYIVLLSRKHLGVLSLIYMYGCVYIQVNEYMNPNSYCGYSC